MTGSTVTLLAPRAVTRVAAAARPAVGEPPVIDTDDPAPSPSRSAPGVGRAGRIVRALDELGITPEDLMLRRPTLDEVFLTLTDQEEARWPDDDSCEPAGSSPSGTWPTGSASPGRRSSVCSSRSCCCWSSASCFGGAIPCPGGGDYIGFLLPGMLALSMMFGRGDARPPRWPPTPARASPTGSGRCRSAARRWPSAGSARTWPTRRSSCWC